MSDYPIAFFKTYKKGWTSMKTKGITNTTDIKRDYSLRWYSKDTDSQYTYRAVIRPSSVAHVEAIMMVWPHTDVEDDMVDIDLDEHFQNWLRPTESEIALFDLEFNVPYNMDTKELDEVLRISRL